MNRQASLDSLQIVGFSALSKRAQQLCAVLSWVVLFAPLSNGFAQQPTTESRIDFARQIQPILSENCFHCHGPDENQRQADLRLDLEEDARKTFVPGEPTASELIRRIGSDDPDEQMPPADSHRSLTAAEKELLQRWVEQGGAWARHWALVPIRRPQIKLPVAKPLLDRQVQASQAIDFLVGQNLQKRRLTFSPRASRRVLIRRVAIDLTGLPPTPQQVASYLNDSSPRAYAKMVDRFLESKAYGERMAWPWLDAARYADSNGYQADQERTMWPWRDWVIESYNRNLPFDQFSIHQLAGDLIPDANPDHVLATAFNRNHPINGEGGRIAEENRIDYVMDMTETTGTVWLGLTFNCCRCHDHKYDPISQKDYYRLFAFFNQTPIDGSGGNAQTPPILAVPSPGQSSKQAELNQQIQELEAELARLTTDLVKGQSAWEQGLKENNADQDQANRLKLAKLPQELVETLSIEPTQRTAAQRETLRRAFLQTHPPFAQSAQQLKALRGQQKTLTQQIPQVMVMKELAKGRTTFVLQRGSYQQPGDPVVAAFPALLQDPATTRLPKAPSAKSPPLNRMDLAQWLFDPSNPLPARVAVNRIWAQVFGVGLVKTTADFGVQGEPPSHPELLDWLAAEYRDSGWDTKHMMRLILNSHTYQQTSQASPAAYRADPENRWLARGARYRIPAWMFRDYVLAASGRLVPTIGGPPVNSYQPAGVWEEASFGKKKFVLSQGDQLYRRSIYTFWRRIAPPTLFFDNADRMTCSVNMMQTNTPLHALTTLNDVTFVEAARLLATIAIQQHPHQAETTGNPPGSVHEVGYQRISLIFQRLLVRDPKPQEVKLLLAAIERTKRQFEAQPSAAADLIQVGHSKPAQALDPIELASWTNLALAIMNLDETLNRQ